jgi:hypothetical protein
VFVEEHHRLTQPTEYFEIDLFDRPDVQEEDGLFFEPLKYCVVVALRCLDDGMKLVSGSVV